MEIDKVKKCVKIFEKDLGDDRMDYLQKGYLKSYYFFIDYFQKLEHYEAKNVVIGAGFTYSWMDKILSWRIDDDTVLDLAANVLNEAKKLNSITEISNFNIKPLKDVVAGSFVGTSKLLHFVNPNVFPIYDSHVCKYLNGDVPSYKVNTKKRFLDYIEKTNKVIINNEFQSQVYEPIIKVLKSNGLNPVSNVRALEMVIFHYQRKTQLTKS